DERWGMARVDLDAGVWQSWILPRPQLDALRCAEMSILWPLAQITRLKGLHLIPAASVTKDGWGALILTPARIEPELSALTGAGWRIIGQRWTALREEDGKVSLL